VTNLIKEKDGRNDETIGETMEILKPKFENPETFNNFVCCLLMSELEPKLPKSSNDEQVEIKANLFTGIFQVNCNSKQRFIDNCIYSLIF
jgi:hypothetical protein